MVLLPRLCSDCSYQQGISPLRNQSCVLVCPGWPSRWFILKSSLLRLVIPLQNKVSVCILGSLATSRTSVYWVLGLRHASPCAALETLQTFFLFLKSGPTLLSWDLSRCLLQGHVLYPPLGRFPSFSTSFPQTVYFLGAFFLFLFPAFASTSASPSLAAFTALC